MISQKKRASFCVLATAAASALLGGQQVLATDAIWAGGSGNWSTENVATAGWLGSMPDAPGDSATFSITGKSSATTTQNLTGNRTVGKIELSGGTNENASWSIALASGKNVIMNQDGGGNATPALISITTTSTAANPSILITGGAGAIILNDDLLISNTSTATRAGGAIQIDAQFQGNGNLTFYNISNSMTVGQIALQRTAPGGSNFGGNTTIAKGAVTYTRGDRFTPTAGDVVTIGSAGNGDATLGFVGGTAGAMENNFVAAANTGGTNLWATSAATTGILRIKSSSSETLPHSLVTLNGDLTFSTGGTGTFEIGDPIVGVGTATKTGPGLFRVTNTNTYTGGTIVNAGSFAVGHADFVNNGFGNYAATDGTLGSGDVTVNSGATQLQIETQLAGINVIADTAALSLAAGGSGGRAQLDAGINDTVGGLVIGGVAQTMNGTYGSSASGATFQNDAAFSGTGMVTLALGRSLYWDTDRATAGAGGATPNGNWNGTAINFNTDSTGGGGGTQSSTTLATDPVVFTAGADGTGTYTVNVSGTQNAASVSVARGNVTLAGGTIATPTFNVATGASATVSSTVTGGTTGSLTKTGPGTLSITSTNSYTGGTNVQGGKLVVNRLHENNAVSISGDSTLQVRDSSPTFPSHPAGNNAFVSRPGSMITIANDGAPFQSRVYHGTLDLGNNDLIVDYSDPFNSPRASIEDMVRSGFNFGDWFGTGITSSAASSDFAGGLYALGVADNSDLIVPFGDGTSGPLFDGQIVDDTTVLVKFTHRADIDLDGVITSNDAAVFNGQYTEGQAAHWATGDLDYDGIYSSNDAAFFNGFYDESLQSLPEPGTLSLLGLMGLGLARRRRRA